MKKVLLTLALVTSLCGFAQVFEVGGIQKLETPANPLAKVVAISPQGDYILLSDDSNTGLTKFDLSTQESLRITDAKGAGFNVRISDDGQNIIYRETTTNQNHLRYSSLKSTNLATGKKTGIGQSHS